MVLAQEAGAAVSAAPAEQGPEVSAAAASAVYFRLLVAGEGGTAAAGQEAAALVVLVAAREARGLAAYQVLELALPVRRHPAGEDLLPC